MGECEGDFTHHSVHKLVMMLYSNLLEQVQVSNDIHSACPKEHTVVSHKCCINVTARIHGQANVLIYT